MGGSDNAVIILVFNLFGKFSIWKQRKPNGRALAFLGPNPYIAAMRIHERLGKI
jgi:hypothetical protein